MIAGRSPPIVEDLNPYPHLLTMNQSPILNAEELL